ncbi:hypothetical protein MMC30_007082 [Trapelia coarctata]|nr:hypothetical protein [Trapelia coarctata]
MAGQNGAWDQGCRQRMAENITLLQLLDSEPGGPAENELPTWFEDAAAHQLSLEKECGLADHLAFLSASTRDPYRVTAVCIEEDPSGIGLTVRMAVNKGSLDTEKCAFERVVVILARIALQGRTGSDLDEVLGEIMALDRRKILSRLRSKHAPWPRKPRPAVPQLTEALKQLEKASQDTFALQGIKAVVIHMQELFTTLEAMDRDETGKQAGLALLGMIVKSAHELALLDGFEPFTRSMPGVEEETKLRVRVTIQKLGRYYEVCLFLTAAAKRPMFRKVQIEALPLLCPSTRQPQGKDHQASLLNTLTRALPHSSSDTGALVQALETRSGQKFKTVEEIFQTMLKEKHPIHAEIQLLYFYELNHIPRRPRVIASSKSACFLCNLFIRMHGKFYTPRTHGVLYHHWSLPGLETLALLSEQQRGDVGQLMHLFSLDIENLVQSKINEKKTVRRHPNESVVFFAPAWSTSSLSHRPTPVNLVESGEALDSVQNDRVVDGGCHQPPNDVVVADTMQKQPIVTQLSQVRTEPQVSVTTNEPINIQTYAILKTSEESLFVIDKSRVFSSEGAEMSKPAFPLSNDKGRTSLMGTNPLLTPPTPSSLHRNDHCTVDQDTSYKAIARGDTVDRELSASGPALCLSTKHLHVTLTTDEILQLILPTEAPAPTGLYLPGPPCSVSVRVTYLSEQEDLCGNIPIHVKDVRSDQTTLVSNGAAHSPNELYLSHKTDKIRIRYAIRGLDSTGCS